MKATESMANCPVLECDSANYVQKRTPLQTKQAEISESLQYKDGAINKAREQSTARKRKQESVRPI